MSRLRVGLTGGIAAGKSIVARQLADLGAVIIDSDQLARKVVEPGTAGLAAIRRRFGDGVLLPDGVLDRAKMAQIVFADPKARADLNAIVHPLVRAEATRLATLAPSDAVVVQVIPLLVETGQQDNFDRIVVVDLPEQTQLDRLMRRDHLTEEQARARIAAQASRAQRLAIADDVIDNSGTPVQTARQVRELWDCWMAGMS
jgi:dephospho-CoA kinase